MKRYLTLLVLLLSFVCVPFVHADTQTINTVPSADANFMTDLQAFLEQENAERIQTGLTTRVVSGGIGATDASLTHTISTVTAYVEGYYIYDAAVSRTYTASTDTFVLLRYDGTATIAIAGAAITYDGNFVFAEMSNASAQPNAPSGTMMLFEAVTDGSSITTINDYRSGGIAFLSDPDFVDLADAVTTLAAIPTELWIDKDAVMDENVTVPANINLKFIRGNIITTTSYTLEIYSAAHILAPCAGQQLFDGTIDVDLTTGAGFLCPDWFGASTTESAANNKIAFDYCIATSISLASARSTVTTAIPTAIIVPIHVPSGTYTLDPISVDEVIILIGQGRANTRIKNTDTSGDPTITVGVYAHRYYNGVSVQGIAFEGNGSSGPALKLVGVLNGVFKDIYTASHGDFAIELETSLLNSFIDIESKADVAGLHLDEGSSGVSGSNSNTFVNYNVTGATGTEAIHIEDGTDNTFIGGRVEDNHEDGALLEYCINTKIYGMRFEGNNTDATGAGYHVIITGAASGADGIMIDGCIFSGTATTKRILGTGVDHITISNCYFSGGTEQDIDVDATSRWMHGNRYTSGMGSFYPTLTSYNARVLKLLDVENTRSLSFYGAANGFYIFPEAGQGDIYIGDPGETAVFAFDKTAATGVDEMYSPFLRLVSQAADPSLAGWGASDTARIWYNSTTKRLRVYYDGLAHMIASVLDVESISADGVLSITGPSDLDSSGGVLALTLADGADIGQTKTISMATAGNNADVTIAHHETNDDEVARFDAVDEYLLLLWTGTEWATINNSCTFP